MNSGGGETEMDELNQINSDLDGTDEKSHAALCKLYDMLLRPLPPDLRDKARELRDIHDPKGIWSMPSDYDAEEIRDLLAGLHSPRAANWERVIIKLGHQGSLLRQTAADRLVGQADADAGDQDDVEAALAVARRLAPLVPNHQKLADLVSRCAERLCRLGLERARTEADNLRKAANINGLSKLPAAIDELILSCGDPPPPSAGHLDVLREQVVQDIANLKHLSHIRERLGQRRTDTWATVRQILCDIKDCVAGCDDTQPQDVIDLMNSRRDDVCRFLEVWVLKCDTIDDARRFQQEMNQLPELADDILDQSWFSGLIGAERDRLTEVLSTIKNACELRQVVENLKNLTEPRDGLPLAVVTAINEMRHSVAVMADLWDEMKQSLKPSMVIGDELGSLPFPEPLIRLINQRNKDLAVRAAICRPGPSTETISEWLRIRSSLETHTDEDRQAEALRLYYEFKPKADDLMKDFSVSDALDLIGNLEPEVQELAKMAPYQALQEHPVLAKRIADHVGLPTEGRAIWHAEWLIALRKIVKREQVAFDKFPTAFREAIEQEQRRRQSMLVHAIHDTGQDEPSLEEEHALANKLAQLADLRGMSHSERALRQRIHQRAFDMAIQQSDLKAATTALAAFKKIADIENVGPMELQIELAQGEKAGGVRLARTVRAKWPRIKHHMPRRANELLLTAIEAAWNANQRGELSALLSRITCESDLISTRGVDRALLLWHIWVPIENGLSADRPKEAVVRALGSLLFNQCDNEDLQALHPRLVRLAQHWRDNEYQLIRAWGERAFDSISPQAAEICAGGYEQLSSAIINETNNVRDRIAESEPTRDGLHQANVQLMNYYSQLTWLSRLLIIIPGRAAAPPQPPELTVALTWITRLTTVLELVERLEDADPRAPDFNAMWRRAQMAIREETISAPCSAISNLVVRLERLSLLLPAIVMYARGSADLDRIKASTDLDNYEAHADAVQSVTKLADLIDRAGLRGRGLWRMISSEWSERLAQDDRFLRPITGLDLAGLPGLIEDMGREDQVMRSVLADLTVYLEANPGLKLNRTAPALAELCTLLPQQRPSSLRPWLRLRLFLNVDPMPGVARIAFHNFPDWLQQELVVKDRE